MNYIAAICIVGIVTWGIYKLFELFARRKERMAIIEKLGEGFNGEDLRGAFDFPLFFKSQSSSFSTLKASLLLIGIGIGLISSLLFQYYGMGITDQNSWEIARNISELKIILNFSGVAIFGGLGLLIAYLIEAKKGK